ncbi:hypothetical protein [Candidatus Mycoplasma haematominutum]|uniref:hypothetical protein n=1 Tax=Candidatus Mycoplasma haematominutum TaxID=209446 RepID=UPI00030564D7|nr:hypothetical protein [Candidatus Mycoplasma haematominutum]
MIWEETKVKASESAVGMEHNREKVSQKDVLLEGASAPFRTLANPPILAPTVLRAL